MSSLPPGSGRHHAFVAPPAPGAVGFADLAASLGCRVRSDALARAATAPDASHVLLTPSVVVAPPDADVVAKLLPALASHGLHLTFRSGGTSLSGQAVTDSVLLDVRRSFRGMDVLDDGARVRVQGGVTLRAVNQRLARHGRRLGPDPSSEVACTIGGVVANNSSGMACGIEQNAYRTLDSVELVLASGLRFDTGAPDPDARLRAAAPGLHAGLLRLRDRVRGDADSVRRIRAGFAMKNTMGYGLNSFLDHDSAAEILAHLMVGSEGTLGFVVSATFRTVPLLKHRTTSLVLFESMAHAARAVPELVSAEVTLAELMDSRSLAVGRAANPRLGPLADSRPGQAALLVERQTGVAAELESLAIDMAAMLCSLDGAATVVPATDQETRDSLWRIRKGLYASVAAARPPGTTALLEDVVFPVPRLPVASVALAELLVRHDYPDSVVFGHAKDGNLHFMLTDRFEGPRLTAYAAFTEELVDLVLGHGGSLKAEHGTGRVMAPFVARQYGDELYAVMLEVKALIDPDRVLNPGVVVDAPTDAHLRNLKSTPSTDPEVDACVECGYCEPVCPSRDLTLTPRQRIALRRAEASAHAAGVVVDRDDARDYELVETCAVDGMCQTACPVLIDTGSLVSRLRADSAPRAVERGGVTAARHWGAVTRAASMGLRFAGLVPKMAEASTRGLRAVAGDDNVPAWTPDLPAGGRSRTRLSTGPGSADVVLFPSCMGTIFGGASAASFLSLCERAGLQARVPDDVAGLCCGTPWTSKGLLAGATEMRQQVVHAIGRWAAGGEVTVVVDAASCSGPLGRTVSAEPGVARAAVVDAVDFVASELLPHLLPLRRLGRVALHPTCGTEKNGSGPALRAIAQACAHEVVVADSWGCCAFAGDRGILHPELTASATAQESSELRRRPADAYVSDNRACQVAMTRAVGHEFRHVLELLAELTDPDSHGQQGNQKGGTEWWATS